MSDDFYARPEAVGEERFAQATSSSERRPGEERFAETQQRSQTVTQAAQSGRRSGGEGGDFWSETSSQSQSQPPPATSTQSTGSAWDRLRRGGARPPIKYESSANQPTTRPEAASSETDLEKDRAQREFDAMLERERGGEESSRKW